MELKRLKIMQAGKRLIKRYGKWIKRDEMIELIRLGMLYQELDIQRMKRLKGGRKWK